MPAATLKHVHHRDVERDGFIETFMTARLEHAVTRPAEVESVFAAVAEAISERGLAVLQEKVYGVADRMEELLAARAQAYSAAGVHAAPATFIDGTPCVGGIFAGVQLIGVTPRASDVTVRTSEFEGRPVGRVFETPTHRSIYLAGVSGAEGGGCVTEQGMAMFHRTQALLDAEGFKPTDIVRTWIYLARLLDWYGEFNRVRTACFKEFGLIGEDRAGILPASTGIQCKRHANEECFMDVFAVAPRDGSRDGIEPMRNTRQNEAYEYGSSFCRGMTVSLGGPPAYYVSGTASINPRGETVYHGDHQGQVVETLLDVHALLLNQGSHFHDICQATAYCKGERDYRNFRRFLDFMDRDDMPIIPVYADVCRDELLFEMDAVAVGD